MVMTGRTMCMTGNFALCIRQKRQYTVFDIIYSGLNEKITLRVNMTIKEYLYGKKIKLCLPTSIQNYPCAIKP
jgi:hypothetical protein